MTTTRPHCAARHKGLNIRRPIQTNSVGTACRRWMVRRSRHETLLMCPILDHQHPRHPSSKLRKTFSDALRNANNIGRRPDSFCGSGNKKGIRNIAITPDERKDKTHQNLKTACRHRQWRSSEGGRPATTEGGQPATSEGGKSHDFQRHD